MVKLSIIILSYNTKQLLLDCLESIFSQTKDISYEVIVVDNASTDGSVEAVERRYEDIKILRNKENLGFAKGNNIGIKEAKGEYILLLNSDTVVKDNALEKLIDFFNKNKDVAAISPLLLNPDKTPQLNYYMRFPSFWQIFLFHHPIRRFFALKIPILRNIILFPIDPQNPIEVDQLPGAALMARREVWEKVGFLDENFIFLFEDVDWSYRAKKAGLKLVVVPEAKVVHLAGASWQKKSEASYDFYFRYFFSLLQFCQKHYSKSKNLGIRLSLLSTLFCSSWLNLVTLQPDKFIIKWRLIFKFLWS